MLQIIPALSAGTLAMLVLILTMMKWYRVKLWKAIPVTILLTIMGTISTYIWYWVECCDFGGRSYFGAVFLVPVAFIYIAKILRIPYGQIIDFCAPAECAMLAVMKYQCLVDGCCGGVLLFTTNGGTNVYFPCQILELANAFIIMAVLMWLARDEKKRGKIYAWYLLIYGVTRFGLNFFRADYQPILMGLANSNIWCLVAIFWGWMWLRGYKLAIVEATVPEENTIREQEAESLDGDAVWTETN